MPKATSTYFWILFFTESYIILKDIEEIFREKMKMRIFPNK